MTCGLKEEPQSLEPVSRGYTGPGFLLKPVKQRLLENSPCCKVPQHC